MADQPPQQPDGPPRDPSEQAYQNEQYPPGYGQHPPQDESRPPQYEQPPQYPRPLPHQNTLPDQNALADQNTQPMFGDQSRPAYPRQDLLPQEVQPAPSRLPLVLALVVVLLVIGGGIGAWLVLRDNGESGRADYCAALKELVPDNDLIAAVTTADASTAQQLTKLANLAPSAVHDDWQTLTGLLATGTSSSGGGMSDMFAGLSALKSVVEDANDKCGMSIQIPNLVPQ